MFLYKGMEDRKILLSILLLVSQALLMGITSAILSKSDLIENRAFEIIYYLSKIITIKNIVANNHNSEIISDFHLREKPLV